MKKISMFMLSRCMLLDLFYKIIYFTIIFSEHFAGDCSVFRVRAQVKFVIFQSKLGILFCFSFINLLLWCYCF